MTVPFLETRPRPGSRRLLLVSYSFPPDGRVGAKRWEMMLRYAAEHGWTADVLLMDPAASRDRDDSRLAGLPDGLRLFAIPFPELSLDIILKWRRRVLGLRRQQTVAVDVSENGTRAPSRDSKPSLRDRLQQVKRDVLARHYYAGWRQWALNASTVGTALAREVDYACVVSSGPPHMAHEAARQISAAISRPLILDFRDPWTSAEAEPADMRGATWTTLTHDFERSCVTASALISVNTEASGRYMRSKYPELAGRVITVMNGADPISAPPEWSLKPFTISYTGGLYGGRRPRALFGAFRRVVESERLTQDDICLHFMGVDAQQRVALQELAKEEGIEPFFHCEMRRPLAEANALLDRSAMVVLLDQTWVHSIPAKLFEYVQRSAWILALSEPATAIAELLSGTEADIVQPDNVDDIAAVIRRRFHDARSGVRPNPLNADGRFSRERQAQILFQALDRIVPPSSRPSNAPDEQLRV